VSARLLLMGLTAFSRRVLGLRPAHFFAAALAGVAAVVVLVPLFWWLGVAAYGVAGVFGALAVVAAYFACAAAALVALAAVFARFVLGRARRSLGLR